MPSHWNSHGGILKLNITPSHMRKTANRLRYTFRRKPARIIVSYLDEHNQPQTRFISIVADDALNEADLTRFLADCLSSDKDIDIK